MRIGVIRVRVGLEAGRRPVARGLARKIDDAMMLGADEIEDLLARAADARPLVNRRRGELAWVRANPGAAHYGSAPGAMPDLRGLPIAGRRVNAAMLFLMAAEITAAPPQSEGIVRGLAASGGTYRGRVRVIKSVEDLHLLRTGEILVCPSTCAAWMMVFHRLITDFGGALTHTSIVAREHRLPAVVGAHCSCLTSGSKPLALRRSLEEACGTVPR